jgi:hypothetical protein
MANNLFYLFLIFGQPEYVQIAKKMVQHITPQFVNYPMAYSNWGNFMLKETEPFFEVVFSGKQALSDFAEFQRNFYPNVLFGINTIESEIPLFKNRFNVHKNQIFVCEKGVCKWPVETVSEARKLLVSQK